MNELVPVENTANSIRDDEAILNITWSGQNGNLSDPIPFDASDAEIIQWATESVVSGYVAGIAQDDGARFDGFVVDRFSATEDTPYNRVFLRPKTPFGF